MASRIALLFRSVRWIKSSASPSIVRRFCSGSTPPVINVEENGIGRKQEAIVPGITPESPVQENGFDYKVKENGCDYKHWLIQVKDPVGSRDEIIDGYIKLLANVFGSEDEARKRIYSVSSKYYFAIGALMSQDLAYKFKQFSEVKDVVPDCYVNRATKDYGGEPFIDGKPVPYDPKYHDLYERVQARITARKKATQARKKATQQARKKATQRKR